jgi:nitrous oxidase accessory protein NosD
VKKHVLLVALVAAVFAAAASPASAVTRWVNNDDPNGGLYMPPGTSCTNPGYPRIQDAVNAAFAGDTILVCPGTYAEQVTVATASKNNLTLRSVTPDAATIKAPLLMLEPGDLVTVDGARNVTLRDFVVAGPLPDTLFCSIELRSGVRVKGGGSANILGNRITEIRSTNPALRGCQNGFAIALGRNFQGQVGSATIVGNRIDRYQKGGIYVDNAGSQAAIVGNQVLGEAALNTIAQNGIQISRGATALVKGNLILDHAYITPFNLPEFTASGIILFQAGQVLVDRNELQRNQDGIGIYSMATGQATVSENRIIGGVSFDPLLGMLTLGDGIYAGDDTAGNKIRGNFLRENVEHDCHDDSGATKETVRNIWQDNDGLTSQPPGLCRPDDHGDEDDEDDHHKKHHGGYHNDD